MVLEMFGKLNRRDLFYNTATSLMAACVAKNSQAGLIQEIHEFVGLLKDLSLKPTGPESVDNLMTNEDSIASVMDQAASEVPQGTVYLGVGPDQNFSLIAATKPHMALIIDYRKKNQLLHFFHLALIHLSNDRTTYLEKFWARDSQPQPELTLKTPDPSDSQLSSFVKSPFKPDMLKTLQNDVITFLSAWEMLTTDDFDNIRRIQARLAGPGPKARFLALKMYPEIQSLIQAKTRSGKPGHWLASDDHYQTVRNLVTRYQLLPIVGDWAEKPGTNVKSTFRQLSAWLISKRLQVGCIYISDVEFFLMRGSHFSKYIANLSRLPLHHEARVVRTSTREIMHNERLPGQSSTTIVRPLADMIHDYHAGKIGKWDDLFL